MFKMFSVRGQENSYGCKDQKGLGKRRKKVNGKEDLLINFSKREALKGLLQKNTYLEGSLDRDMNNALSKQSAYQAALLYDEHRNRSQM